MTGLTNLTVDELAEGICLRAGRIAAGEAELLVWIGEFDRREGWAGPGMLSCAHWLSWRIGLSPGAAREQVRVARRLDELPAVTAAFTDGRISLSNVVLVCSRHHTLIHSLGFQLVLHPDRRLEVRTADGVPVLHHPTQPWGDPAALAQGCGQRVSAETLPPDHCTGRLDLRYAVSVLLQQAS